MIPEEGSFGLKPAHLDSGPFKKPAFPADTHFLFCNSCRKMYENYQYAPNHIVVVVHSNAKGNQAKGMMPLLKAWAAFIEYFSGHTVTFTIGKPKESTVEVNRWTTDHRGEVKLIPLGLNEVVKVDETKLKDALNATLIHRYSDIIHMSIIDEPFDYADSRVNPSYAYMNGVLGNLILFKTGVLLNISPGAALTYMVHEFTSHRYDKDHSVADKTSPDYYRFTTHYSDESPHEGHCATSPRGKSKCLNGFIDSPHANFKNAVSFFTDWYNKHKGHKITMFDTSAPAPPPRTVAVPAPPTGPTPPPPKKKKQPSVEEQLDKFVDGEAPIEDPPEPAPPRRRGAPSPVPGPPSFQVSIPRPPEPPEMTPAELMERLDAVGAHFMTLTDLLSVEEV